jgi:signal transduction histidine kinase/ligand-binding sensor domain-containing protein
MEPAATPPRLLARIIGRASIVAVFSCTVLHGQAETSSALTHSGFMIKGWTMADGLPHLSVTALAQTADGCLWIGTLAGLARFDGVRFKVFTPQNCPELPRSRIGSLFTLSDGTLFIATERGGGLVALRGGKFEQLLGSGDEHDEILACLHEPNGDALFVARSGALWQWSGGNLTAVSTNRAFYPVSAANICLDGSGQVWMVSQIDELGRLVRYSSGRLDSIILDGEMTGAKIHAVARDADGQVWLGTSRGLARLRKDRFEPVHLPEMGTEPNIAALTTCRDGGLWICSTNYWQRKFKAGRWVGIGATISGVQTSLEVLGEDRWGSLCLGRYPEGLVTVSEHGTVTRIDSASGLPGASVDCLLADREGNEWLGLFDGGLVRLQPRRFSILGGASLTTPVYSICEDHEGSIWVGTSFAGVYRFQGTNLTRYEASDLPLTDVWSLFEDSRSNLWVGTSSHGVYQFRAGHFVPKFDRTEISDRVNAIHEDRKGRVWFGHWSGLACYEDGRLTRMPMPWFSDDYEVVAIASDPQDRLWLGTKGAGLFCLSDGKFTSYTTADGLLSNLAWSLFVDPEGALWIGTADGGLSLWRDGKFTNFTTRDGLPDNTVCHIAEDSSRRLWFSSPHCVSSVEKEALEAFAGGQAQSFSCTSYDQSDGMLSASCTCAFQPSGCATRDGRLLFPTLKGVVVVQPDAVHANTVAPAVLIEDVTVDGKIYDMTAKTTLTAPPGRARLVIQYTALSYSAPEKVRFKYRMEGLDSAWVDGGAKRSVDYSYLPHGRYKFQVRACNNDGVWSTQNASFDLIIPPHFWQTWWFLGAALLGGGAGIALTARRVEKINAQRRLERERQAHLVELERARIARDFHDDVGARLTHVIVLSELLREDKGRPKEVEAHAAMIGNTARNAVRELGTIIWAANPRNDTLDSLVQYISQYSYDFFQATPIACHLDLPAEVPAVPLAAEMRHNLFMVVKEALHNILKHSHASEARLRLVLQDGILELRVEDNGDGFEFDPAVNGRRSGLSNMRHRIEAIGATLRIESSPGGGTSIQAKLPYPPTNDSVAPRANPGQDPNP